MPAGEIPQLLLKSLTIVLIDLVLAGDNALVIAMAVRTQPPRQRKIAIAFGAAAAVVLRVVITILAARLLGVEFIKLAGGIFIIWIAIKVLIDASASHKESKLPGSLLHAIWLIVFADITMSIDNVLAVAGAAEGSIPLIIFGLGVSIPFVIFASNMIAKLMDRYPVIVWLGAALLGKVGGGMMFTDPWVTRTLHPSPSLLYVVEAAAIALILAVGKWGGSPDPRPTPPSA